MNLPLQDIAEAFSLTAEKYDRFAEDHPNLSRMRSTVYAHLMRHLQPGARDPGAECGHRFRCGLPGQPGFLRPCD